MPGVKNKRRFRSERDERRALLISLSRALIIKERIKTTEAKAKELSKFFEPLVTISKEDSISSRRKLARYFEADLVKKMIEEVGPKYKERPGGYTRIIKLGPRDSDGARMVFIEMV